MKVLIYIHGFLSSPNSFKARLVKDWLTENRSDIFYECPYLSAYPAEAKKTLIETIDRYKAEEIMVIGSSLGGFWATWLTELYGFPSVLVNPAAAPSMLLPEYLGVELKNFYTDDVYILDEKDVDEIRELNQAELNQKEKYWLMVQTGDESLDYRLALKKYAGCRQLVEEGGDHSFQQFERWIPSAVSFLETA